MKSPKRLPGGIEYSDFFFATTHHTHQNYTQFPLDSSSKLSAIMAKSARSSRIKKNNSALKKRVFGPVEIARNERLSAKLLELAKQPKPERGEMDIQLECRTPMREQKRLNKDLKTDLVTATDKKSSKKSKTDKDPESIAEGGMPQLSATSPMSSMILRSLSPTAIVGAGRMPTPPPTPPSGSPRIEDTARENFYHALGLSTDINGFTLAGDLDLNYLGLANAYDSIE
jgi:hypothetical protein